MKLRLIPALVALVMATCAFTCHLQQKESKLADSYAHGLVAIHKAADSDFAASRLTADEHTAILRALLRANELGIHLNQVIRDVNAGTAPVQAVADVVTEIGKALDDGTAGITNRQTRAELQLLVESVKSTLSTLEALSAGGRQ
jgi:hypothetical protein